jgi:MORN repeat
MKYSLLYKASCTLGILSFPIAVLFAQECKVEKEPLKGTYTGDCKNGKANGKGKAVGTDTYEGDFKSGLPDGQGTYTWANGSSYTGKFAKGLKEGKGALIYKRTSASDSLVEGYWLKDQYAGKNEKPYKIYFTSKLMTQAEVEFKKDAFKQITFNITNTSGAGTDLGGETAARMTVDDINMVKGHYTRIRKNDDHAKKSETVLDDIVFPARMKVTIGTEQIEIEFYEEGSYVINIRINQ